MEVSAKAQGEVVKAILSRTHLAAEEFLLLKTRLRDLAASRPLRCVGMVSASAGEGKTTVSLGLAVAAAQEAGRKVLLVEADLRKPSVESTLRLPRAAAGLREWLEGRDPVVPLRRIEPPGLELLASGGCRDLRPEILGSKRMAELLSAARATYDLVVVDCPPLIPVADAVILQDLLDGFILVVRSRRSPRETLLKAVSYLKPDRIAGVVFNDHREILPSYHSYAYRRYGYKS